MKIRHRFAFMSSQHQDVFVTIPSLTNKHKLDINKTFNEIIVYESDPNASEIIAIMQVSNIHSMPSVVFSASELQKAQWLEIFTLWSQYEIQPSRTFPQNTFKTLSCEKCYYECEQIDDFALGTRPNKWKKKFLNVHIPDEMLVPDEVAEILSNSELKGFHFRQVIDYKTRDKIPNINQLVVERTLEKGRVYYPGEIREMDHCPVCGFETVVPQTPEWNHYKTEIFDGVEEDIVKTGEKHRGGRIYRSRLIISHKFCDVLKKNRLDKVLMHSVVDLV